MIAYIRTTTGINFVFNNAAYTIDKNHPSYNNVILCIKNEDYSTLETLLDIKTGLKSRYEEVVFDGDNIIIDGLELNGILKNSLLSIYKDGLKIDPLVNFIRNLRQNPSYNSVLCLYSFLEIHGLPLDETGCFLAYKSVRNDYMDKYSGKFNNKPGSVMEVPRNKVDDNPNNHCSYGFHVGALEYGGPGGWYNNSCDKVIIVKVNPKDVVSVPTDHSCQKMRVCKYEVVADYQGVLNKPVYSGEVNDDYSSDDDEEDDWYDEDEELTPYDMLVGNSYEFTYTDQHGNTDDRHGCVEENHKNDEYIICRMLYGDHSNGSLRRFNYESIEDISEV